MTSASMPSAASASAAAKRLLHHARDGDDRDVVALALDVGHAERDTLIPLGHFAFGPVEDLVLEKHHQIVVANRAQQSPLASAGVDGTTHLMPGMWAKTE